jgi:hypothetical protein
MENPVNYNVIKIMNNKPDFLSIGLKSIFYTNTLKSESKYYLYINVLKKDLTDDITEEMIEKLADKDLTRFNSLLTKSSYFLDNYCDTLGYTEEKIQKMLELQNEIDFNNKIFTFLDKYELIPCSEETYNLCCYKLEKEEKNQNSFSC